MSDDEAKSPRLFDVRTIDRNIRKGLTTRKDYDKYLKSLPDVTEKVAPHDAVSFDADDDLDDEDLDDEDDLDDDMDDDTDDVSASDDSSEKNGTPSNGTPL